SSMFSGYMSKSMTLHDLALYGRKLHTKRGEVFRQIIQKHLRLLLFEDKNDIVCIFQIDNIFTLPDEPHRVDYQPVSIQVKLLLPVALDDTSLCTSCGSSLWIAKEKLEFPTKQTFPPEVFASPFQFNFPEKVTSRNILNELIDTTTCNHVSVRDSRRTSNTIGSPEYDGLYTFFFEVNGKHISPPKCIAVHVCVKLGPSERPDSEATAKLREYPLEQVSNHFVAQIAVMLASSVLYLGSIRVMDRRIDKYTFHVLYYGWLYLYFISFSFKLNGTIRLKAPYEDSDHYRLMFSKRSKKSHRCGSRNSAATGLMVMTVAFLRPLSIMHTGLGFFLCGEHIVPQATNVSAQVICMMKGETVFGGNVTNIVPKNSSSVPPKHSANLTTKMPDYWLPPGSWWLCTTPGLLNTHTDPPCTDSVIENSPCLDTESKPPTWNGNRDKKAVVSPRRAQPNRHVHYQTEVNRSQYGYFDQMEQEFCIARVSVVARHFTRNYISLALKGVPPNSYSLQRLYGLSSADAYTSKCPLSSTFTGPRECYCLSPFLLNFVVVMLLRSSLPVPITSRIEMLVGRPLKNVEYADRITAVGVDI
ncbi:hypothetical protein CLF_111722, partial [Clonorchis sinensis]